MGKFTVRIVFNFKHVFKYYFRACFIAIKKKNKALYTSMDNLKKEINLVYGREVLRDILLFYLKTEFKTLFLMAECCDTDMLIRKHKQNGNKIIFQSEDLYLPQYQRIKIRPTCSIGAKPGNAAQSSFFFMSVSEENCICFQVEIKRHLGGTPNAILEFSTDNRQSIEITKAEFSLDRLLYPVKSMKRHVSIENSPPLHEIASLEDITETSHDEHIEDTICTIDAKDVISTEEVKANIWLENVNEQQDNDGHEETSNSTEISITEHTDSLFPAHDLSIDVPILETNLQRYEQ